MCRYARRRCRDKVIPGLHVLEGDGRFIRLEGHRAGRVGHEFGATTGRPRRCGWLDLVALRYACLINGVTQLTMMKADVLSGFEKIKVCTAYNYRGEEITHLPYSLDAEYVTPIYSEFKGWKNDITQITTTEEIPTELADYIEFLENELQIPISIVSVGPDRVQTIKRNTSTLSLG